MSDKIKVTLDAIALPGLEIFKLVDSVDKEDIMISSTKETLVGYSYLEREREKQYINNIQKSENTENEKDIGGIISGENDLIV